ncbi:MAG: hypothetical protein NTW69_00650 [Chloroflexi bacterium]|nr:hypothetical protein [Chloroflexota bacterium]
MNAQPVTEIKQHEYALLNEIAVDSMVTCLTVWKSQLARQLIYKTC